MSVSFSIQIEAIELAQTATLPVPDIHSMQDSQAKHRVKVSSVSSSARFEDCGTFTMIKNNYQLIDAPNHKVDGGLVVWPVSKSLAFSSFQPGLDSQSVKKIEAIALERQFTGAFAQFEKLLIESNGRSVEVVLLGCGRRSRLSDTRFQDLLKTLSAEIVRSKADSVLCGLHEVPVLKRSNRWKIEQLIHSIERREYRYNKKFKANSVTKSAGKKRVLIPVKSSHAKKAQQALDSAIASARAVKLARNLGDMPANLCTPSYLANFSSQLADKNPKLACKVLDEEQMSDLGMGALLAITRASVEPAKLIVIEYQGGAATDRPYCLIGKGVTFDSGGLSLKPPFAMEKMKYDMCGAAAVLGALNAAAELKLPINLLVLIPAAENLPGGAAVKPGDVVDTLSGLSVEVLNTDAEGRLLLCDALTYAKQYKPRSIIDVATLTGSCIQALGKHMHCLFSNSETLARSLLEAGSSTSDLAWRMPLNQQYREGLKSKVADMRNIGGEGAGAVVAAIFLQRFAKRVRWAHMDVAGTATKAGAGATGRPVELLVRYLSTRKRAS